MAAQYGIDIKLALGKALGDLDKLTRKLKGVDKSSDELQRSLGGTDRKLKDTGRSAQQAGRQADQASRGFDRLRGTVTRLAGAFALVQTGKFIFGRTAELETQTRSLKVLTGELKTAKAIISDLQQFAAVTPFTSSDLIDTAKRLRAFGVETQDLVRTTRQLADVAGATGAELNGVATAYGQIQAKGRLQTEELLQLQERGIDLATELKEQYNLTGEEFAKALQKGQISADAVAVALDNVTRKGGQYANGAVSQSDTLNGRLSTLQDNLDQVARTIGQTLEPIASRALQLGIRGLELIRLGFISAVTEGTRLNKLFKTLTGTVVAFAAVKVFALFITGIAKAIALTKTLITAVRSLAATNILAGITQLLANKPGAIAALVAGLGVGVDQLFNGGNLTTAFANLIKDGLRTAFEAIDGLLPPIEFAVPELPALTQTLPPLLGGNGNGSGDGSGNGQTADEKTLERQLAASEAISREQERRLALLKTEDRFDQQLLQNKFDLADSIRRINTTAAEGDRARLIAGAEQIRQQKDLNTLKSFFDSTFTGMASELETVTKEATLLETTLEGVGQTLKAGLVDGITAAIDGSRDLNAILADTLKSVGKLLINAGLSSLGKPGALFAGGIPGFADGGVAPARRPALVGERGPEIITPLSPTLVSPFDEARGAIVSPGVDRSSSEVDPFGENTAALGSAAAVQQARASAAEQQRLDAQGIKLDVGTYSLGDLDVVSTEQMARAVQMGVKAAEAKVYRSLKNQPARRAGIGI